MATAGQQNQLQAAPFLFKTYELVEDPGTNPILSWGPSGRSFVVYKPTEFARDLLPKYFKHSNFSSFVRQLNTYGFRKVDTESWEFANEHFIKGQPQLLTNITRRKPNNPTGKAAERADNNDITNVNQNSSSNANNSSTIRDGTFDQPMPQQGPPQGYGGYPIDGGFDFSRLSNDQAAVLLGQLMAQQQYAQQAQPGPGQFPPGYSMGSAFTRVGMQGSCHNSWLCSAIRLCCKTRLRAGCACFPEYNTA
jgi:hypothetical protein